MPLPLLIDVSPMDTLLDDEFYESLDLYEPKARGFQEVAARHIPPKWTTSRKGIWCMCRPDDVRLPEQGWKIHVSSTPNDAAAVLSIATRLFVRQGTAFKFAIDEFILSLQNGKSWSRGGSGKFITGYPADARSASRCSIFCAIRCAGTTVPTSCRTGGTRTAAWSTIDTAASRRDSGSRPGGRESICSACPAADFTRTFGNRTSIFPKKFRISFRTRPITGTSRR